MVAFIMLGLVLSVSLYISIASVNANGVDLLSIPSVGWSVYVSGKRIVAKQLIRSGCRLGW